jgi:DNA-binding CsgD family transcriptional regulator
MPLELSAELAATIPNGALRVLEGSAAALFIEDPIGDAELIAAFVTGRPGAGRRPRPDRDTLTPREREVARLIAAGESNGEIGHRLSISVHTVERHTVNLYRKIGARGRADAAAWAIRNGLG